MRENKEKAPQTIDVGVKKRKYNDCYLDFGFTLTHINDEERPKYVLCMIVFD